MSVLFASLKHVLDAAIVLAMLVTLSVGATPALAAKATPKPIPPLPKPPVTVGVPIPKAVIQTREQLIKLATLGKYEELEALGLRSKKGFRYHTGFEKTTPARLWRREAANGQMPLQRLAALMKLVPVRMDGGYMWPAVATAEHGDADWEDLKTVYPPAKVLRYKAEGYTGWRVTVDRDGQWRSFFHQER